MSSIRLFIILVATALIGSAATLINKPSPDEWIIGNWTEVKSSFEKIDIEPGLALDSTTLIHEISAGLLIHQTEKWEFKPNGVLVLHKSKKKDELLKWQLKGRGNILEITHPNNTIEQYQIQYKDDQQVNLHFNFDLQVRGIMKLSFKRA